MDGGQKGVREREEQWKVGQVAAGVYGMSASFLIGMFCVPAMEWIHLRWIVLVSEQHSADILHRHVPIPSPFNFGDNVLSGSIGARAAQMY